MARGPVVNVTVTGDSTKAEKAFKDTGRAADRMEDDITDASRRSKRSLDDIDKGAGNTERGFRGLNDGIGGTTGVLETFGVSAGGTVGQIGGLVQGFTDLAGFVGDFATQIPPLLTKMGILTTVTTAQATATGAETTAQYALNTAFLANPIFLVIAAIVALVAIFVIAWKNSETFREIVTGAFDAVKGAAETVFNWVKDNWPLLLAILTGPIGLAVLVVVKYWDDIKAPAVTAFNWVKDNWPLLLAIITGPIGLAVLVIATHWGDIKRGAQEVWTFIKTQFDNVVTFITGLPERIVTAASGMFDGIKDAFRSALNFVIRGWNGLQFSMPAINTHIPGVGTIGGFTVGVPDIPELATGGIVLRPTLALIGEAGPEAVVPLGRGRGSIGGDIYLTVNAGIGTDGRTIGQQIRQVLVEERRRIGSGLGLG